jgi:hypothetical protein
MGIFMNNEKQINTRLTAKLYHMYQSYKKLLMLLLICCFVFSGFPEVNITHADTALVTVTANYIDEVVNVASINGSTKIYMSTDNQKTWELIDTSGVVDISSLLTTKAVTIYFKGNKDTSVTQFPLPAEDQSLKVTYKITSGVGSIAATATGSAIEFRKGNNGAWKTATTPMSTAIYEIKGATLNFRTPATASTRAGKIVTIKIPKRPSAPSVKLDGSKLNISGLKSGETQYRVGDSMDWITFTSSVSTVKYLTINTLLNTAVNTATAAQTVEFRTVGSDKKLYSGTKLISIPAQPVYPDTVTLTGTTLKVTSTDLKKQYEYTLVSKSSTLDLTTAKWTTFTAKNSVVVTKASLNDKIYVRAKSYTDSTTKQLVLASTYKEFVVSSITSK